MNESKLKKIDMKAFKKLKEFIYKKQESLILAQDKRWRRT